MTSMTKITVGLVGFGTASSVFHAPLLQSSGEFEITHVVERSTQKSLVLKPCPTIVRSCEELLASSVQLVVIATPTALHFDQAKSAILAKKHVVVDKPLCVLSKEAQELSELAKEHGVVFSVFHNRRWDSDFLTIKKLIQSKALGEITKFEAHYDRYRPTMKGYWKEKAVPGGGILYDLGAHLVDQALCLFGVPSTVDSVVQIQREGGENDDYFRLTLKYTEHPHLEVILTGGMLVKELGPKYILDGTNGSFEKYGEDVQEQSLRDGKLPQNSEWGKEPKSTWGTLKTDTEEKVIKSETGSYEVFYNNIAAVIRNPNQINLLVDPVTVISQICILENAKKTCRKALVN